MRLNRCYVKKQEVIALRGLINPTSAYAGATAAIYFVLSRPRPEGKNTCGRFYVFRMRRTRRPGREKLVDRHSVVIFPGVIERRTYFRARYLFPQLLPRLP